MSSIDYIGKIEKIIVELKQHIITIVLEKKPEAKDLENTITFKTISYNTIGIPDILKINGIRFSLHIRYGNLVNCITSPSCKLIDFIYLIEDLTKKLSLPKLDEIDLIDIRGNR